MTDSPGSILDFNDALSQRDARKRVEVDAERIRHAVTARGREFVEWMFPAAVTHRSGRYAVVGDVYGAPGESLTIELTGSKAGHWHDFANPTDAGKDLIGLFMATMGMDRHRDFAKAIERIQAEFLGESAAPLWSRPVTQQLRERAKAHEGKPRPAIDDRPPPSETYTYEDADRNVIGLVRRHEFDEADPETGKPRKTFSIWCAKTAKAQAPSPRPLYRIPEIIRANHVVFVEGERKANALASCGIEATCIMFGSNAPLDKVDWTPIAGKLVTLWPDNDPTGHDFAERLIPILQALGCRVARVRIPDDVPPKWDAADAVSESRDAFALVDQAEPVDGAGARTSARIRLLDIDELEDLPAPSWLIDGVLTDGGLSVTWGKSGALKSFVALDMGLCVATGIPWQGHATKRGLVIYIAAEGSHGLARRTIGWRRTKGANLPKPLFKLVPHTVALTGEDLQHLIAAVLAAGDKAVLIIIDTLARTFGAGDENKQADMNAYVTAADALREATGANVMIIHHSGVHEDKRERGSNVLRGAADTVININRRNLTQLEIINEAPKGKQKDAPEFPTLTLRTQTVTYTQADVEQTTLVLMRDDDPLPNEPKSAEAHKLGKVETAILNALKQAGEPLGLTRLHLMTEVNKGSLTRSLATLTDKQLIDEIDDEAGFKKLWRLA